MDPKTDKQDPKLFKVVAQANLPNHVKVPYRPSAGFSWSRTEPMEAELTEAQLKELEADPYILIATVDGKAYTAKKDKAPAQAPKHAPGFQPDAQKALDERDAQIRGLTQELADLRSQFESLQQSLGGTPKPKAAPKQQVQA